MTTPVLLRTAADRIIVQLQIQRSNERFLDFPTSLDSERGLHAEAAYASDESLQRLGATAGDYVHITQQEPIVDDTMVQVWPERGFWSRSVGASVELFLSATHAAWHRLQLDAMVSARRVDLNELPVWQCVSLRLDDVAQRRLVDVELLRERLLTRCVLERSGSLSLMLRNGSEITLSFQCNDNSAHARWGRVSDDTVIDWLGLAPIGDDDVPLALLGDEAIWCERVVHAMLVPSERARLARVGLAYDRNTILLTGASGVGKSRVARLAAIGAGARVLDCSLVALQRRDIAAPHVALDALFNEAVQCQPLATVLLLDDVDEMLPGRASVATEVDDDIGANVALSLQQIVLRMQRFHSASRICLLATARSASFALARLFAETIELAPPTPLQRRALLQRLWRGDESTADVADRCHGYMVCDLRALCVDARRVAFESGNSRCTVESLERARQQFAPTAVLGGSGGGGGGGGGGGAVLVQALTRSDGSVLHDAGAIAGLDEQRALLSRALGCLDGERRRALLRLGAEAPRGVLLYGVPGVGKTQLARHTAALASGAAGGGTWHFAHIDAAELVRSTVGDSERRLAAAFLRARQCAPCVLFIDEIEALFGARDDAGSSMRKLISQLLVEFDALTPDVAVLVIGATNRPQRIDSGLLRPGRFDELIYVPPPDADERVAILQLYAARLRLCDGVSLDDIASVAKSCFNFTGADLKQLCNRAVLQAVLRAGSAAAASDGVRRADFDAALRTMRPSVTLADLNLCSEFTRQRKKASNASHMS
jgi:SpoVK/Ycf46/Vps4 family AAA+-type ATPase